MARSTRTHLARIVVIVSILLLLIGFVYALIGLFSGGHDIFGSAGQLSSFIAGKLVSLLAIFLILALIFFSYSAVWRQLGWIRIGAKQAAIILAIVEVILGIIFLGTWVTLGGIAMFIAWIILIL